VRSILSLSSNARPAGLVPQAPLPDLNAARRESPASLAFEGPTKHVRASCAMADATKSAKDKQDAGEATVETLIHAAVGKPQPRVYSTGKGNILGALWSRCLPQCALD
jgi:hypothetical protein